MDREVALENKIATILYLKRSVEAGQIHLLAFAFGELGSQNQSPIVESLADDVGGKPIGGGLQMGNVVNGKEGIIVLSEANCFPVQFLLHEVMAVEIVGGLKGKERTDAYRHRSEHFVSNVKVEMGEAAAFAGQETMVGVLGGELRHAAAERRALLHALQNEIDTVAI